MKYLKDILNLKENRRYKIIIIILVIVILILQTSLSISNKKIQFLNTKINKLNTENIENNKNSEIVSSIDEFISTEKQDSNSLEMDEDFKEVSKELIEKYVIIAEENNKKYLSDIENGKKVLVFESMTLSMTDGQIKKSLSKITSEEFGIYIEKDSIGNKPYYKIYLIEKE